MMDHPSPRTLQEHVDGMLNGHDEQEVRSHVGSCRSCSLTVSELMLARHRVRDLPGLSLPPDFAANVATAVRSRAEEEQEWSVIEKTAEKLLAGIAIIVILLLTASETLFRPDESGVAQTAGLLEVYIRDTTTVRLLSSETITRDDVLAAALTPAEDGTP